MHVEGFEALRDLYNNVPDAMVDILNEVLEATQIRLLTPKSLSISNESRRAPALLFVNEVPNSSVQQSSPSRRLPFPTVILQASRLAAAIYFRTVKQSITFENLANRDDAKHLAALLNATPLSAWTGLPFIYLWV